MKPPQFLITVILSVICLFLSIMTIWQGLSLTSANASFESEKASVNKSLTDAQGEINRGNQAYQFLNAIVQEIYGLTDETKPTGKRDDKLKALLTSDVENSGFKINIASPSPSPSASPASSPTTH